MKKTCTGVILSGGENNRFGNKNKAFVKIRSVRIIDRIYNIFKNIFDNIVIVTGDPVKYIDFDCLIVTDHYEIRSSLNGIHAGLFASPTHYSFFIACDIPLINQQLIEFILKQIDESKDIIIPETSRGFEPLFAVYSKNCLKPIEKQLENKNFRIRNLLNKVRIKKIKEIELRKVDPDLTSFFNINSLSDLIEVENNLKNIKYFLL